MLEQHKRAQHFRNNYLAWIALNHFLSAGLVRELSCVFVDAVSAGDISLDQLFEEELIEGSGQLQSWAIRPLETKSPLAAYLQHRIRALVWQHDADVGAQPEGAKESQEIGPEDVELAIHLGKQDLFIPQRALPEFGKLKQQSIAALVSALHHLAEARLAQDALPAGPKIEEIFDSVEMPLQAVFIKHIGDLCADADDWQNALLFYNMTEARISRASAVHWANFIEMLHVATLQSQSSALRMTKGAQAAALTVTEPLSASALSTSPLFLLNASHDAMVADIMAAEELKIRPDRRASILLTPLLLASHDTSSAIEYWFEERFTNANQNFWAVLRRQIALGSASESRITKAQYARSLLGELEKTAENNRKPEVFWMATRLLLESGQSDSAKKFPWSARLVRSHLDEPLVNAVIEHVNRHNGSKTERISVAIECFANWVKALSHDQSQLAKKMLSYLTEISRDQKASPWGSQNVGSRSLELLIEIAEKRPEFRFAVASEIVAVVGAKLSSDEYWKPKSDAIKLAQSYLDVFSDSELREVVAVVLAILDGIDPSKEMWPIVQPAMELLTSREIPRISTAETEFGSHIVSTIVRFGLNQKSEHAHALFYLQDFDLSSLKDSSVSDKLQEVVQYVGTQALATNASNAGYNINALLFASKISGQRGLGIALDALERILKSADSKHPSISLAYAYQTLSLLADRQKQIESDTSIAPVELRTRLKTIFNLVVHVWKTAQENPMVFSSFSIPPPTKPNATIIHNWAYSSIGFAQSLGQRSEMLVALSAAESQSALRDAIILARATRLAGGDIEEINPEAIRKQTAEAFYASLGQRLIRLRSVDEHLRRQIVEALLEQCFRVGPRGLDAGVFLASAELEIGGFAEKPDYLNYRKRLDIDRELRLALFPMLNGRD